MEKWRKLQQEEEEKSPSEWQASACAFEGDRRGVQMGVGRLEVVVLKDHAFPIGLWMGNYSADLVVQS